MKTKFILHGGYAREENILNDGFHAEMVNDIPEGGSILIIYFASNDEEVEEKYERDSERMRSFAGDKEISVIKATGETFIEEVRHADVVYICGGDTQKLKTTLDKYPDFVEAIKGKTIVGSSAGIYVLSRFYFANSLNKVMEGYDCIPARVVCHYESTVHTASEAGDPVSAMGKYDPNLELVLLKDHEWQVREVEL